jgi:hypothetical protein
MYNYSVALAHRVQHKVLKNTVNLKLRHLYTYHVLLCLDTLYIQVLKTY